MGLLDGKVALVSGLGPGLGRSVALAFAREGAAVVMAARRADTMTDVAAEITAMGGVALARVTDLAHPQECASLAAAARDEFGRVDILVNNAFDTDAEYAPLAEADLDSWRRSMESTYWSALGLTKAVVAVMRPQPAGRVVMIGSLATHRPQPTWGSYVGPKAALLGMVRLLAVELGPLGIRVNAVQPAHIFGPTVQAFFESTAAARGVPYDAVYDEAASDTAIGYLPSSDEVAGAVLFFACGLSDPVTGQTLNVNAGAWLN
jgi:NAD(P)-dependent dehydrogenase (short-subunit alcohol dehydrogenase family)